jgi:hypothetical protein
VESSNGKSGTVLYALFVFVMFVPSERRLLADYTGIKKVRIIADQTL